MINNEAPLITEFGYRNDGLRCAESVTYKKYI